MFTKIKMDSIKTNNIKNYLKYAIGELIIIISGILVAVYLNNRNAETKNDETLVSILEVIQNDLKQDTARLQRVLEHYNEKRPYFDKVTSLVYNKDTLSNCARCASILKNRRIIQVSQNGFNQLEDFQSTRVDPEDSEISKLLIGYNLIIPAIEQMNEKVNEDILETLELWRDNYPWFTEFLAQKSDDQLNKEMRDYFSSKYYQNRVTYHKALIYENYLPLVKGYLSFANQQLKVLAERLENK